MRTILKSRLNRRTGRSWNPTGSSAVHTGFLYVLKQLDIAAIFAAIIVVNLVYAGFCLVRPGVFYLFDAADTL